MRFPFIFFAAFLGFGLLMLIGRFIFAIWLVAVFAAVLFFAFRGMRDFIRRGRGEYLPYGRYDRPGMLPAPEGGEDYEPLVPVWRQSPEELSRIRVIPVK